MMRKELKLGIFAVVVLVASFFVLNYLRGEDIFNRENEYTAQYPQLDGLVASAPVYIKGYKAGKVSEVWYDSKAGVFNVVCSVSKQFEVPSDSKMTIYSVDIMGGKGLRIDLGESETIAEDGASLTPAYEVGLMDGLMGMVSPLIEKVQNTIDSLGTTVSGVNRLLSSANTDVVTDVLGKVQSIVADLQKVSAQVGGKSEEIADLIENLQAFSGTLEGVMVNVDSTLTSVGGVVASLNEADLTGTVNSIKTLVDNINDPDGSVGKLLNDGSVYNSVDSLLNNLDRFVDKIQENPKKYLKISVF
jgi:phospholipid/cholesterol/gamma-HCH transport system substrate-binding protein